MNAVEADIIDINSLASAAAANSVIVNIPVICDDNGAPQHTPNNPTTSGKLINSEKLTIKAMKMMMHSKKTKPPEGYDPKLVIVVSEYEERVNAHVD